MAPKFIVRTSFTAPVPDEVCLLVGLVGVVEANLVESTSLHEGALVRYLALLGNPSLAQLLLLREVVLMVKFSTALRTLDRPRSGVWLHHHLLMLLIWFLTLSFNTSDIELIAERGLLVAKEQAN